MSKTDLEIWAKEIFWSAYTGLTKVPVVTKYGPGNRGEVIKKITTLNPSKELRERIISAIAAQMLHRRNLYNKCGSMQAYIAKIEKSGNKKFYGNRHAVTWINQMGYEDEIPSSMESKPRAEARNGEAKCITLNCNYPIHGPRFKVCAECIGKEHDPYRDKKREYLRDVGVVMYVNETLHDYSIRCQGHRNRTHKQIKCII